MLTRFKAALLSLLLLCPVASVAQDYVEAPSMAINLEGVTDWSTQHPFIDLRKSARPWLGHTAERWGAISPEQLQASGHLDDNGWPVSMPSNVNKLESLILTDQPTDFQSIRGLYRLTYSGDVRIEISGAGRVKQRSQGEIWFEYPEGATGFVGIGLTRINPDAPLTALSIVHEDWIEAHEAGAVFNPRWIDHIKDFRVLRFMDWMGTNNATVSQWDDLRSEGDYTYGGGVPLSVMVELANYVGADPWFTLPHLADDDLVTRFAQTVRDELRHGLKAYVEFSNELWNFQFQQTHWADAQARELWGWRAGGDAWVQYAALRAAQVAAIFDAEFGDQANERLVNVVGVHTAWPDLAIAQLEGNLFRREWDTPLSETFDAIAVTGYLWPEFDNDDLIPRVLNWHAQDGEGLVFDQLAQNIRNGSLRRLETELWPTHAEMARKHGLDLVMYEGGTHVILPYNQEYNEEAGALLTAFNYSPQMVDLYQQMFDGWSASGGQMFNAFLDVANPSRFGSWGHLRHLDDMNDRWQAVADENLRPSALDEARGATDFAHGVQVFDASTAAGTPFADLLVGTDGDDVFTPNGGNDLIHGSTGFDQVLLTGAIADYDFTFQDGRLSVQHASGLTKLTDIEFLFFADEGFGLFTEDLR